MKRPVTFVILALALVLAAWAMLRVADRDSMTVTHAVRVEPTEAVATREDSTQPVAPVAPAPTTAAAPPPATPVEATPSVHDRLARRRDGMIFWQILMNEFEAFVEELDAEMSRDPALARLADAYADQFELMFEDQSSPATLQRLKCGPRFCIAEFTTPHDAALPDLGHDAAQRAGLALSIPGRTTMTSPDRDTMTRVIFATLRSPPPEK